MRDEFVGENRSVGFYFYNVDSERRHFGEDGAAEGVGEGEVNVGEFEVDVCFVCLMRRMKLVFFAFEPQIWIGRLTSEIFT